MRNRHWSAVITAALVAALGAPKTAGAASFDCAKAQSDTERLVCTDAALGARDEILSKVYTAALHRDVSGQIRAAQREWLAKTTQCRSVA